MMDQYPRQKPQDGTKIPWLDGIFNTEPGEDLKCPDEQECDNLMQVINNLTYNRGSWCGSTDEILLAANASNLLMDLQLGQINLGIIALEARFELEGVKHLIISGGDLKHVFFALP